MNLINIGAVKPKVSTFMSYNITRIMESVESKEYNFLTPEYVHTYRKTSNISLTLVDNKIVDNSDVIGAPPVGAALTTSSFSNNCTRIQETFKLWDLVRLILEVLQ